LGTTLQFDHLQGPRSGVLQKEFSLPSLENGCASRKAISNSKINPEEEIIQKGEARIKVWKIFQQ
jgi:hypothetical protein